MNYEIVTPDEFLRSLQKPQVQRFDDSIFADSDFLIVAAGFEDRTIGVLQELIKSKADVKVIMVRYEPCIEENRADEIRELCQLRGIKPNELTYDRRNPAEFGQAIVDLIGADAKVVVDISAMSRLLIVQIIVAFAQSGQLNSCTVAYCEAKSYAPTEGDARQKITELERSKTVGLTFLSTGVFEIAVIPELSSATFGNEQTRLVFFPSFDSHHLLALRAEIQPSRITFIEGLPPDPMNHWRREIIARVNDLNSFQTSARFTTCTLDYRETLELLLEIYRRSSLIERLLVAPTGSKMQTVAVAIFRAHLSDVQVVFPTATGFGQPKEYSLGVGAIHSLHLGRFRLRQE